jgi:ribonuclease P protein component
LSLPKSARLLKRRQFLTMKAAGSVKTGVGAFTVVGRPNGLGFNRLGLTMTKKSGPAVVRNRLKRVVREFFRTHRASWLQGYDLLFIARPGFDLLQAPLKDSDARRLKALVFKAAQAKVR